jgi:hypothetical protein
VLLDNAWRQRLIGVAVGESKFQFRERPWEGRDVVPFEYRRSSPLETTEALEAAGLPPRGIRTKNPSGLIHDLVQDRRERQKAREHRNSPRRVQLTALLREETLKAMDRARELGFTEEQVPYAAPAALLLERFHGKGKVTLRMVREHCERKYPHKFGDLSREQAA